MGDRNLDLDISGQCSGLAASSWGKINISSTMTSTSAFWCSPFKIILFISNSEFT